MVEAAWFESGLADLPFCPMMCRTAADSVSQQQVMVNEYGICCISHAERSASCVVMHAISAS